MEFELLPTEILHHIMTFASTEDVISVGQAGSYRLLDIARDVLSKRRATFWIDLKNMPGRNAVMGDPVPHALKNFFGQIVRRVQFVGELRYIEGKFKTMHPIGFSDFNEVLRAILCELVKVLCNRTLGIRRVSRLDDFISCLTISTDNDAAMIAALCVANRDTLTIVENGRVLWHDHFVLYEMPKLREINFNVKRDETSPLSNFTFIVVLTRKLKLFSLLCPDLNQFTVVVRNCTVPITSDIGPFFLKSCRRVYINLFLYSFERLGWAEGHLPPP